MNKTDEDGEAALEMADQSLGALKTIADAANSELYSGSISAGENALVNQNSLTDVNAIGNLSKTRSESRQYACQDGGAGCSRNRTGRPQSGRPKILPD